MTLYPPRTPFDRAPLDRVLDQCRQGNTQNQVLETNQALIDFAKFVIEMYQDGSLSQSIDKIAARIESTFIVQTQTTIGVRK